MLFRATFLYQSMPECHKEFHQFANLRLQLCTFVGVAHPHAMLTQLHNLGCAHDISTVEHCILGRGEWLVLHKLEAAAMEHKSITGNTCRLMVGFRKTTVDDH